MNSVADQAISRTTGSVHLRLARRVASKVTADSSSRGAALKASRAEIPAVSQMTVRRPAKPAEKVVKAKKS